ncbi:MAG: endolytic transglycosylase MltG [Bifidobacteriaceae bacterium]|nr:endolytic transglycosylase MltG [Bifidobacteriaceae bacterium]
MTQPWNPFGEDEAPPTPPVAWQPAPATRGELRAERHEASRGVKEAKRHRWVGAVVVVVLVAVVAAVGWFVGKPILDSLTKPKDPPTVTDYPGPGEGEATIVIDEGDLGRVIAQKLVDAGVIASTGPFIALLTESPDQAASIQPGTYLLQQKMSAKDAFTALLNPDNRNAIVFTVPEGKRAEEVYQIIAAAIARSELGSNAAQADVDAEAARQVEAVRAAAGDSAAIGLPAEANGLIEGWLQPQTYAFNIGTEPTAILAKMVAGQVAALEDLEVPRAEWMRTITVASMVEREARIPSDRGKVARVFLSRLNIGMKLQSDATVMYGVGRFDTTAATTNAERQANNPFNTYVVPALPAGAIANPGFAALEATVHPTEGPWIYFVTICDATGETEFNETFEGHQASVAKRDAGGGPNCPKA